MPLAETRKKQLKDQIGDLVKQAYLELGQEVGLLKGTYLVRVLPKEHTSPSGRIILADMDGPGKQNKPLYEAVVLQTYSPYKRRVEVFTIKSVDLSGSEFIEEDVLPIVEPGDHIMFQHWEGVPVPSLDMGKGEYRILKEDAIQAKLNYETAKITERLKDTLSWALDEQDVPSEELEPVVAKILERFNVVSRSVVCKTLSGE